MSWWWTEDPAADFARHDRKQTAWLNSLPKCSICKEPIQQERAFEKNGFWICDECYENNQRMVNECTSLFPVKNPRR